MTNSPPAFRVPYMTTFTTFTGVNPPVDQLPADFQTAILDSQSGAQTPTDDNVIGSALSGSGYCAQDAFKQQLYCACVNSPVPNPECIFAPCANQADAYKTVQMQKIANDAQQMCPTTVNCTQVFEMGGSNNIASNVSQTMNCGGVVETFITNIEAHPIIAILILILVISTIWLVSEPDGKKSGSAPRATAGDA